MDEDLQIVDVNEPERESDEFNDVCKKKRRLQQTSLLRFTRYACTKYSGSTPTHD